jgi:hypothetical protein
MPEAGGITTSQSAVLVAVQEQVVVRLIVPDPPTGVKFLLTGLTVYRQLAPCWVSVNVASATVMIPVRAAGELLVVADQATVPLPVPDCPEVIVSHDESLVAVRLQLLDVAVMLTVPVFDAAGITMEAGERTKAHAGLWVMLKEALPTLMVPLRVAPVEFGSTE